jgi:hypothetical protein
MVRARSPRIAEQERLRIPSSQTRISNVLFVSTNGLSTRACEIQRDAGGKALCALIHVNRADGHTSKLKF